MAMHRTRTGRMCTKLLMEVTAEKVRTLEKTEENHWFLFYVLLYLLNLVSWGYISALIWQQTIFQRCIKLLSDEIAVTWRERQHKPYSEYHLWWSQDIRGTQRQDPESGKDKGSLPETETAKLRPKGSIGVGLAKERRKKCLRKGAKTQRQDNLSPRTFWCTLCPLSGYHIIWARNYGRNELILYSPVLATENIWGEFLTICFFIN